MVPLPEDARVLLESRLIALRLVHLVDLCLLQVAAHRVVLIKYDLALEHVRVLAGVLLSLRWVEDVVLDRLHARGRMTLEGIV